jgi:hypothetical protein
MDKTTGQHLAVLICRVVVIGVFAPESSAGEIDSSVTRGCSAECMRWIGEDRGPDPSGWVARRRPAGEMESSGHLEGTSPLSTTFAVALRKFQGGRDRRCSCSSVLVRESASF